MSNKLFAVASAIVLFAASLGGEANARSTQCPVGKAEVEAATARARELVDFQTRAIDARVGRPGEYGFSVAVSACGEIVWAEGFGSADLENDVPVTPQTKFRIGSVSKTLTAAAIGRLVDEGRLDLDAEVQAYAPDFPRKTYPVTIRQLGGHLGGIRHYEGDEFLSATRYSSVSAALDIFKDDPLINRPGSAYVYSSYGWNLISAAIEGASGDTFLDYMQAAVFDPAGMTATTADHVEEIVAHRTRFYSYDVANDRTENAPFVDNSAKWAGGGFLSTPSDILRFAAAMGTDRLVSAETYDILTTSQTAAHGAATGYGIGWAVDMAPDRLNDAARAFGPEVIAAARRAIGDAKAIGHTGGSVGGLTIFATFPDAPGDIAIAATSNNSSYPPLFAFPAAAAFIAEARDVAERM
ncbi:MAG: serine hydrolase [Alphaproteobacteria bacterium]|nr:serine hydrolase [Alphaproteobacteria bacterium]